VTVQYLLDTSVVSQLAPGKAHADPKLVAWLRTKAEMSYLSAITVMEVEQGIRKLRRTGGVARADAIGHWLDALIHGAAERVLPFDTRSARIAGQISDRAIAAGRHPGFADVAIAAIALAHGLTILTLNAKHFAALGVPLADPTDPSAV
jgi:toxin FitB